MTNDITDAFKRKEWGWAILYIVILVIGFQWFGIIGGAVLLAMVFWLYRIIKNPSYSRNKKILLSALDVVGGLIVMVVLIILFQQALYTFFGIRPIPASLQKPLSAQTFSSTSTPALAQTATSTVVASDLESVKYVDSKANFSINYPKGWTINTNQTTSNVEFDNPSTNDVGVETVSVDDAKGFDLTTYSNAVFDNFKGSTPANADLKIVAQGNTTLDGYPAYEYEITFNYAANSQSYPMHGIYIIALNSNTGYVFSGFSLEQSWATNSNLLNESAATLNF